MPLYLGTDFFERQGAVPMQCYQAAVLKPVSNSQEDRLHIVNTAQLV